MRVKALRGVCVGVGQHLKAADIADLEPALVTFLTGIGAVAPVLAEATTSEPADAPEQSEPKSKAGKSGVKEK